jgi:hypothetical protein
VRSPGLPGLADRRPNDEGRPATICGASGNACRAGEVAIFDRSWYGRVLVERVEGLPPRPNGARLYEINEFEAGRRRRRWSSSSSSSTSPRRSRTRGSSPGSTIHGSRKVGEEDFRNRARRADYLAALADMFEQTRWAPGPLSGRQAARSPRLGASRGVGRPAGDRQRINGPLGAESVQRGEGSLARL